MPVALLNQVPAARCEWLVPGLLKEKVPAYAKGMPQRLRHKLGPLAEFAQAFAAAMPPRTCRSPRRWRATSARTRPRSAADAFRPDSAPPHLHMNFRVLDEHGRQLAMGRNLAELKEEFGSRIRKVLGRRNSASGEGETSHQLELRRSRGGDGNRARRPDAGRLSGAAGCVGQSGDGVALQVFDSPERAREVHRAGVRRLLAIAFRERLRDLEKALGEGHGACAP